MGLDDIASLETTLKLIQSFLTSLAILVGGAWAYLNFVKGRVYHSKLELGITLGINFVDGAPYLLVTSTVKNVGLGRVDLDPELSALVIEALPPSSSNLDASSVNGEMIGFFDVFCNDRFIESGESIQEQSVIKLKNLSNVAFRSTIRLVGKNHWMGSKNYEWDESAMITASGTK